MVIWFDLTNSPHVNFFARMIEELQAHHTVIITCRPLANTIDLLEQAGCTYSIVGKHYGASLASKMMGFGVRVMQLYRFLREKNVEAAISHSSFYSPVVARLLNIRCIYLNDNEHALGNRPSFLCANTIMIPEFLDTNKVVKQGATRKKIVKYPGVKEGVYLWTHQIETSSEAGSDNRVRKRIFIRPEPWNAQYYAGNHNFIDELLMKLGRLHQVTLLARGTTQLAYYRQPRFHSIKVPEKSISLKKIMKDCELFIGAGGTMTREAAVLGIPTISIYQDTLLDVDNYLISKGKLIHQPDLDAEFAIRFLKQKEKNVPDKELMIKGKQAYYLIMKTLLAQK